MAATWHGIRLAMESDRMVNEDVNLSTARSTTVLELADAIWRKVHGADREFRYVADPPFEHDVQMRVPDVRKARELLGFEATTTLDEMLDEVILDPQRGGGRPAVSRLLPELYDSRFDEREVSATDAWREIVGYLQRYVDQTAGARHRLRWGHFIRCCRQRTLGERHPRRRSQLPPTCASSRVRPAPRGHAAHRLLRDRS